MVPEQAAKRQKVDGGTLAEKAVTPKNFGHMAEKTLERTKSEGILISNGLKANLTIMQQSLRNTSQTSSFLASLPNRFKLDNRPTSFRILPPLPADFASVSKPSPSIPSICFLRQARTWMAYVTWDLSSHLGVV